MENSGALGELGMGESRKNKQKAETHTHTKDSDQNPSLLIAGKSDLFLSSVIYFSKCC